MNLIIFDFEVFKYDTLLGMLVLNENNKHELIQTWNLDFIKSYFDEHQLDSIFIGYNSKFYDNCILEAIIKNKNPYEISKKLISDEEAIWCNLKFYHYDVMNTGFETQISLKLTELISGDSIETTEVDFDIDRPLTEEEKRKEEKYNYADLIKTKDNFEKLFGNFLLRLGIIEDWNLDLMNCLDMTGAQIASEVLLAKKNNSLDKEKVFPQIYDTMKVKNQQAIEFYLQEKFRKDKYFEIIKIGNVDLTLGAGGIHGAIKKCYYPRLMYLDVSGYYNLVMILYNLLSRTIPQEGRERYIMMYEQQLELKKVNPSSPKRKQFKKLLLAVFGAQNRKGSKLYDPWIGSLVPVVGEMFLIDWMEKIEDLCLFVNCNTDGIMIYPNSEEAEKEILIRLDEFLKRTKFVIKPKYIYDLYQRDVNNYVYRDEKGNLETKGEVLVNYEFSDKTYASGDIFNCKEPSIIAKGVVNYLMFNQSPEETVDKYKEDLRLFQFACKKGKYKYLTYDIIYNDNTKESFNIQSPSRVFALNSDVEKGMVYKHDLDRKSKVSNLPSNVFVYNDSIINKYEELKEIIDWNYYVDRIYERIESFIS